MSQAAISSDNWADLCLHLILSLTGVECKGDACVLPPPGRDNCFLQCWGHFGVGGWVKCDWELWLRAQRGPV